MVMEDSTKAAIVQQHRSTVISTGDGGDMSISPNPEVTTLNNNNNSNAESISPSISPTSTPGGPVTSNTNVYLIGLEFVRQYYTVLHQGPLYLHRFYSEQSSFVHDDSKVVYGQLEIRDRIEQLNFRNCVAKILQVDSQETLGNGVVIQVRGELSNNGKPLRRFMQTFVLAPQTPKRYYVRNDIFHYQDDESYKDDLTGGSCLDSCLNEPIDDERSEEEEELNDTGSQPPSVSAGSPTSVSEIIPTITSIPIPKQPEVPPPEPVELPVPEVSLLDTKGEPKGEVPQRRPSHGFVSSGAVGGSDNVGLGGRGPEPVKEPDQGSTTTPSSGTGGSVKTFANLFKSDLTPTTSSGTHEFTSRSPFPQKPGSGSGRLGPSPTTAEGSAEVGTAVSPGALSPQPPPPENVAGKNLPPRGHNNFGRERGGYGHPRERRERLTSRSSNATANDDTGSVDGDNPRPRPIHMFPDTHQLFVGNLPHTVTIPEIKEIFEVFGRVAEVKILKPNQKNAGPKVPYFCFVVFEEQVAAEAAIRDKIKITMKMIDGSARRLNVEEKRPRESGPSFGGGPPGNYFSRGDSRNDNTANSGPGGGTHQGGGGNIFRGSNRGGCDGGGRGGSNAGKDGNAGGEFRSQNNPRAHSRTFRGSNRGGGGERGGGGGAR